MAPAGREGERGGEERRGQGRAEDRRAEDRRGGEEGMGGQATALGCQPDF